MGSNVSNPGASATPSGAAGGDLAGSYPNPDIAAGVIVNADIAAGAAIADTKFSAFRSCRVFHNAAQSIANNTVTALAFNSERFDTDGMHDNAVNNSRITFVTAGTYLVSLSVSFATNAVGQRIYGIRLNGATTICQDIHAAVSTNQDRTTVSTLYAFSAGDYVEAAVFQDSGAALNMESTGNLSPEFMAIRLGA